MISSLEDLTLDLSQSLLIAAPIDTTWNALMRRMTVENSTPDNRMMPMLLEQRPGGRWFRDLGNDEGHLWGIVQVIKPPTLLEIHGPLFMSYAVTGHVRFRIAEIDEGCELSMRHTAVGLVDPDHRQGVVPGWDRMLHAVREIAEA